MRNKMKMRGIIDPVTLGILAALAGGLAVAHLNAADDEAKAVAANAQSQVEANTVVSTKPAGRDVIN